MGSPITFSGFNNIDFSAVLNAVMTQESVPLTSLQKQQTTLQTQAASFRTLAAKLATFESAVADVSDSQALLGRTATSSNDSSLQVSAGSTAAAGVYDVVVQELARAQVTASSSTSPDADTTTVAGGGTLTIGGVPIVVGLPLTLNGLAEQINTTKDIGVTATVVKSGPGAFQLVLTGKNTGTANAFSITNGLTGGSGVTFSNTGDPAVDNAVQATDARALVNNIQVVSSSNTLEDAISGVSLNLLKKDASGITTVTIKEDTSTAKTRVQKVIDGFNDLVQFAEDQAKTANTGATSIGRDPMLRGLRNVLRTALSKEYAAGGELGSLGVAGIEFLRTGKLALNEAAFKTATTSHLSDMRKLFAGDGTNQGAFPAIADLIKTYTTGEGLLKNTNDRLTQQSAGLDGRITDLTARLAVRRAALQREYSAADLAMSQLTSSGSSLSSLQGQFRLF
jgi:flagellar hook-associated protein 2